MFHSCAHAHTHTHTHNTYTLLCRLPSMCRRASGAGSSVDLGTQGDNNNVNSKNNSSNSNGLAGGGGGGGPAVVLQQNSQDGLSSSGIPRSPR